MKLTAFLLLICFFGYSQTVTVMTYNVRYDNPDDDVNAWPNRKEKVFEVIKQSKPEILGVQEALYHQLEDIHAHFPQYQYVGKGRDDGQIKGEYSAIFYDTLRFSVTSSNTFWLSLTPDVPGSKNWDAAITRVATWAKLLDLKSLDTLFVMNTHFDHIGKKARENSAGMIKENISVLAGALPVILTGDFNIEPTESPYTIITNGEIYNLRDAGKDSAAGTYCSFKVDSEPCRRIDYIFYGVGWVVNDFTVIDQNDGQFYPSDHLPVIANLKLRP
jgi:endonuclease/exonuclease/phosphatase family metal-dependent hydrolase